MRKKETKQANKFGKFKNNNKQDYLMVLQKGEVFGDSVIGMMSLFATDFASMCIAAVGLAKALAALKNIALAAGMDIELLFDEEVKHFDGTISEVVKEEFEKIKN